MATSVYLCVYKLNFFFFLIQLLHTLHLFFYKNHSFFFTLNFIIFIIFIYVHTYIHTNINVATKYIYLSFFFLLNFYIIFCNQSKIYIILQTFVFIKSVYMLLHYSVCMFYIAFITKIIINFSLRQ